MNRNVEQAEMFHDCESQKYLPSDKARQRKRGLLSLTKSNLSSITKRVPVTGVYHRIATSTRWFLRNILNPQGPFLRKWNSMLLLSCYMALFLDPLFFYIPVVDAENLCLSLDWNLTVIACVLRSFLDLPCLFRIVFQFRTGLTLPYSGVDGMTDLNQNPKAIAKRYFLSRSFVVDVLSILPLPQLVVMVGEMNAPISLVIKQLLVALVQYIPRYFRLSLLILEWHKTSGLFSDRPWVGSAFSLYLYVLSSHVLGALWYLMAIQRTERCWRIACSNNYGCNLHDLYCGVEGRTNMPFLDSACPLREPNDIKVPSDFDCGIFFDALQSNIVGQRNFFKKFLYCLWWGLRNLSSLGQNLKTSTFAAEVLFAISVSIIGLILISFIIGNMAQKYLHSITARLDEMRVKRREAEEWMSNRGLPEHLRERIRGYQQYKWQVTRGIDEDSLIRDLPKDIRRDIKRHLYWSLLIKVPVFAKIDKQLLDSLCSRLKPILYTRNSYIVREGDVVDEMIFIMRGILRTTTKIGFSIRYLKAGDFCGEELLTLALDSNYSTSLPLSNRTIQAVEDVEAFCLMLDDLKFAMSQYSQLHVEQLQHPFRFYSQHWRTWAAGFIQKAWFRYRKRNLSKSLKQAEGSPSLAATVYVSKFATSMLANSRRRRNISAENHLYY